MRVAEGEELLYRTAPRGAAPAPSSGLLEPWVGQRSRSALHSAVSTEFSGYRGSRRNDIARQLRQPGRDAAV